jgi:lipopolysaccharide export LptBFGC system permease protein LptF
METNSILVPVRKKIYLPPLFAAFTAAVCFGVFSWMQPEYKSTTSFYINQASVVDLLDPNIDPTARTVLINMAVDRVFLLANSDELRDSIVKEFDLYHHYGIDPKQSLAHETVALLLNNKIILNKDKNVIAQLNLSVVDKDRFIAAAIANRITDRINRINRDLILKDVQKKLTSYESTLSKLKIKETEQRTELLDFIAKARPSVNTLDEDNQERLDARLRSDYMFNKVDEYSSKYKEIMERYYNVQTSIASEDIKTITVVKRALPDVQSNYDRSLYYTGLVFIISLIAYFLILVFYYENQREIYEFLGTENSK